MRVILSSPLLIEDGMFTRKTVTQEEAQAWVDENVPENFSSHQTTKILGVEPTPTRGNALAYDQALIITPLSRLDFGREYTVEEIKEIGVEFIMIEKVYK